MQHLLPTVGLCDVKVDCVPRFYMNLVDGLVQVSLVQFMCCERRFSQSQRVQMLLTYRS